MAEATQKWLATLRDAVERGTLVKLTLGAYRGPDATLRNVFVRPVILRAGPRLSFVYRHATRDVTQNFTHAEALARIEAWLGAEFRTGNLFTTEQSAQLEFRDGREPRLVTGKASHATPASTSHDRAKKRWLEPKQCPWLHAVGVTRADGQVAKGMEGKFRQLNQFIEVLRPLLAQAGLGPERALRLVDMGCGKGYLTFAAYDFLRRAGWSDVTFRGIEARPELVELCNRVASESGFDGLRFEAGTIASTVLDRVDVLVALHACDTATDDALAKGIQAGASLIVAAPCCHKELRPQLRPPLVLAPALKHGILRERQAEFITDALRAALLEWAGYDTKVFEFISTEHTAKNLMIAATKRGGTRDRDEAAKRVRELAGFYGVRSQQLATTLGFDLATATAPLT